MSLLILLALLLAPDSVTISNSEVSYEPYPNGTGWFRFVPYGHSFYADVHPNFVRFDVTASSNSPAYDWTATQPGGGTASNRYHAFTYGVFGFSLPIWSGSFGEDDRFGLAVTMAASANLWLDIFEPQTAPVVNTDYRIGFPSITFIHRFQHTFAHNYSIAFSPFKHESTHIGDELQIEHTLADYPLRRVNVSYNYTELLFTFNEPEDRFSAYHSFRLGLMLLLNPQAGWYTVYPSDGDPSVTSPKNSPFELFLQYQYQSQVSRHGFQALVSAEIRNRVLYGYTSTGDGKQDERRVFTYNVFVGPRFNFAYYDGYFSRVAVGFRAYYGNCPYGQFRNIPSYAQFGLSLIFD
ncbi:MAG: hypothetical protein MJZ82_00230 [Paludibacteraceae bacterium]|nr:hypothetical protein [Paludibacteraceae bacterium]